MNRREFLHKLYCGSLVAFAASVVPAGFFPRPVEAVEHISDWQDVFYVSSSEPVKSIKFSIQQPLYWHRVTLEDDEIVSTEYWDGKKWTFLNDNP